MDKLGIKATIYDILGYIIPGLLMLIFVYIFMNNLDVKWIISLKTASYTTPFYVLIFILSYVSGHIVSSLSSFIFEGKISNYITKKYFKKDNSHHNDKTQLIFNKNFDDCNRQLIISHCQKNNPTLYETAFVFLTIYGLSRNISICFFVIDIYVIKKYGIISMESAVLVISTILLIRNYYRFKDYYNHKINSSLYL